MNKMLAQMNKMLAQMNKMLARAQYISFNISSQGL